MKNIFLVLFILLGLISKAQTQLKVSAELSVDRKCVLLKEDKKGKISFNVNRTQIEYIKGLQIDGDYRVVSYEVQFTANQAIVFSGIIGDWSEMNTKALELLKSTNKIFFVSITIVNSKGDVFAVDPGIECVIK